MTDKPETDTVTLPDGRVMPAVEYQNRLELTSRPFEQDEIEKLPKQMRRDDKDRYQCRQGTNASADGFSCGGYHARSLHLDYVGHAGITDRLNAIDPLWNWEPMAFTQNGTPLISDGGMWGYLTVLGVRRIGFGDPAGKSGPNATKELIGDFLRNAAMRFGIGTYLWSKSESALAKKLGEEPPEPEPQQQQQQPTQEPEPPWTKEQALAATMQCGGDKARLSAAWKYAHSLGTTEAVLNIITEAANAIP